MTVRGSRKLPSLDSSEEELAQTMRWDRNRLRSELRAILADRERGRQVDSRLAKWQERLKRSIALCEARRRAMPRIEYDDALPVVQRRAEIAAAVREHPVVIVCGETGSGKSTQIPKICLELGRGIAGYIGHTQPRRIAARSIAARLAEELGSSLGAAVGFKIRFAESLQAGTYVKLMTDGILLAECQADPLLEQYDTIIIDEAHERSLNIDFLLGYLKRVLLKRRDLKLIITSATIDAARFAEHFASPRGPAPVIEVGGRTYPVEIRYRPMTADEDGDEPELEDAVAAAVDELMRAGPGDILLFMPTERDIHEMAKALRGRFGEVEILPLYARLSIAEQQRVFQPHAKRRIVIATNVAESSLTVPGIRYVIDPGVARISRYSPRTKTQRLPVEAISQASANQRAGRCGRVADGICIRLYGEDDFAQRDRFTSPEIQRTNLASVILQTKALGLGDIEQFPFLDPPRSDAVRDGYKTLFEIGALTKDHALTDIGRQLARLPVDPRIGRMILAARDENCLAEMLVIAAALELQDPRERPIEKQEAADHAHARFADSDSDFLTLLKLWDFYHDLKATLSRQQLRRACRQNFLSHHRMREWIDIHLQLRQLAADAGMKPGPRRDDYAAIHRAILTGLLSHVAGRGEGKQSGAVSAAGAEERDGDQGVIDRRRADARPLHPFAYALAGGRTAVLWPGSGVFNSKPKWIVAAEVVETSNRYLRCCAAIDPRWIEPIAGHLVQRSYSEVHWDPARASAMAFEKVRLFGLVLVPRRRVCYGPIDSATARELLIRQGLVEGEIDLKAEFLVHNQKLAKEIEKLAAKLRRNDLLRPAWDRFAFYDQRIPREVYDGPGLLKWLAAECKKNPTVLHMSKADLLCDPGTDAPASCFPEQIAMGGQACPLEYRFEPGTPDDGVTITLPAEIIAQIDPRPLGWLVPGLLEQKLVALIRALPKELRRHLIPAPEAARKALSLIRFGEGDFLEAAAQAFSRVSGQRISSEAFREAKIPDELRMNVRVVDSDQQTIAEGRDLEAIRRQLGQVTATVVRGLEHPSWSRDRVTSWDFEDLPEKIEIRRNNVTLCAFPMLVDQQDSIALRLADTPQRAAKETRPAVRQLFVLSAKRELRAQAIWLPGRETMQLHARLLPNCDFERDVVELIACRALAAAEARTAQKSKLPQAHAGVAATIVDQRAAATGNAPPWPSNMPRTKAEFDRLVAAARDCIGLAVQDVSKLLGPLLAGHYEARLAMERFGEAAGVALQPSRPETNLRGSRDIDPTSPRAITNQRQDALLGRSHPPCRPATSRWQYAIDDIREQLDQLVPSGFLVSTPWQWLQHYPRYFKAIVVRLQSLRENVERDREFCGEIRRRWAACLARQQEADRQRLEDPRLLHYRWMLEEYRVSLFAQRLGASLPVSAKRLDQAWERIGRPL